MFVFPAEQEGWGEGLYNSLDAFTRGQGHSCPEIFEKSNSVCVSFGVVLYLSFLKLTLLYDLNTVCRVLVLELVSAYSYLPQTRTLYFSSWKVCVYPSKTSSTSK